MHEYKPNFVAIFNFEANCTVKFLDKLYKQEVN